MKRLLAAVPAVIISLYVTAGNMRAFRPSSMRPLSIAALLLMAAALAAKAKRGGLSAVEKGFFVYLALNALVFWTSPGSAGFIMGNYPTGILFAVLFFMVAVPALTSRSYFTEFFARKSTPAAVWETDIFKTVNRHMTWAWAAIFALSALVTAIPDIAGIEGSLPLGFAFQLVLPGLLMLGAGIPLNMYYPAYFQRKSGITPVAAGQPEEGAAHHPETPGDRGDIEEVPMDAKLRVIALNGSPHEGIGNTSRMIDMIKAGLAAEGIDLTEISLARKKIEFCIGCAACLEKGRCWRNDDHGAIMAELLAADGIILASPVYFSHVTAQMKAFIDRSLAFGHKPRTTWKPGLAVSVSAGKGEVATATYLARTLHAYGAFPVGSLTAIAPTPGQFLGRQAVEGRALDLARDLARAIKEKRQYPVTEESLSFYLFMRDLVVRQKEFMGDDYRHWEETGLLSGFEAYAGQQYAPADFEPEVRKEWLREYIRDAKNESRSTSDLSRSPSSAEEIRTCRELLRRMPMGFNKEEAGELRAVYQFEISGTEEFTAHLTIGDGRCIYEEGVHPHPDVTIEAPGDLWLAISKGEEDGQKAFMAGKYRVRGSIPLLMRMNRLFGR